MISALSAGINEDKLILMGFDSLYRNDFTESRNNFLLLFEETKDPYYAKLAAQSAAAVGDLQTSINLALLYQKITKDTNDLQINKILADGYAQAGEIDKAIEALEKVKSQEDSVQVISVLSNLYLIKKDFKKALPLLRKVYAKEHDIDTLKKIILTHISQNETQKAVVTLSKHLLEYNCDGIFCEESIKIYSDLGALDMARDVFERIYIKNPTIPNATNLMRILVALKQYQEAQGIAKSFPFDKGLLLDLYVMQGDYEKAHNQAGQIYQESKNPKFLALQGVYEISNNTNITKQTAMKAANKLEQAIKERTQELVSNNQNPNSQDAFFYNFLGYLMIDYDIDIRKGLEYVKKALKIEPNSIAYLDSLAWGHYKLGNCKAANSAFMKIPQSAINQDSELKAHSIQIFSCDK